MTDLPELLQELADLIGLQMAWRLAEVKGGQSVFIPKVIPEDHWLADIVGLDNARLIAAYITTGAGVTVMIPKGEAVSRAKKLALVKKMIEGGASANQIAAAANITQRHVFRQKAALKGRLHNRQLDLFASLDDQGENT
jgi:hypothetical protein